MSTGRGDDLFSAWVQVPALIPRVEHGTGGDELSLVTSDFFFGATGGTPASATVTGQDVAVAVRSVSARGASLVSVTGLDATAADGTTSALGAAVAPVTGLDAVLALGAESATGAALATATALALPVTLGTVTATGDGEVAPPTPPIVGGGRFYHPTPWPVARPARVRVTRLRLSPLRVARVVARGSSKAIAPRAAAWLDLGTASVPWTGNPTEDEMLTYHLAMA